MSGVDIESDVLALIPARGGSKGIPRKNIQPVGGKPLVAHSIEHALATPVVTRVCVSTDDGEIAEVASEYGAEVIRRPAEISGDLASSESALLHALDHLREVEGYEPDLVVFLQATSPLRRCDDIQQAVETLRREEADSLFSAITLEWYVWRRDRDGSLTSFTYDYRNRWMRQEAPEYLIETGSIYVFKPWVLREHDNRFGGQVAVYYTHPLDAFQIDRPSDMELVESLLKVRQ